MQLSLMPSIAPSSENKIIKTGIISVEYLRIFSIELAMPHSMTFVLLIMPKAPPYISTMVTTLAASTKPLGMDSSMANRLTGVCSIRW